MTQARVPVQAHQLSSHLLAWLQEGLYRHPDLPKVETILRWDILRRIVSYKDL